MFVRFQHRHPFPFFKTICYVKKSSISKMLTVSPVETNKRASSNDQQTVASAPVDLAAPRRSTRALWVTPVAGAMAGLKVNVSGEQRVPLMETSGASRVDAAGAVASAGSHRASF